MANGCNDQVSADYPGQLCTRLDARGYDSMFITGFCGDVDPLGRPRGYENAAAHGKTLAKAVVKSAKKAVGITVDGIRCGEKRVRLPYQVPSQAELLEDIRTAAHAMEAT